jgi:2-keto-4-pentenoate hydratase/2-oxohepta-3-ene-1,7-dioic acid hydratase in catechol pathway
VRLVSFRAGGTPGFGVVRAGGIVDATRVIPGCADLRDVLRAPHGLARLSDATAGLSPSFSLDEVEYLPPVPNPDKIVCAGSNYQGHRDESISDLPAVPEYPTIFTRFSDSVSGHLAPIASPTNELDFEGEVAAVIGAHVYQVTRENALDAVAAYGPFNDLSVRDWQRHTSQWCPGKNFKGIGAFGPWVTTADEYPDMAAITLTTRVNGVQRQRAALGDLIFGVAQLLVYVTAFTPLSPGDVLVTGTPGGVGVGARPPVYLNPGDTVEVEVTGAGALSNTIR